MADSHDSALVAVLERLSDPDPGQRLAAWEALVEMLAVLRINPPAEAPPAPDDLLEASIREASAIGGRVNAVDLLAINSLIARGALPPSPALGEWLAKGVQAILDGATEGTAFGTRRRQGRHDPLASRDHSLAILQRVNAARAQGFKTQPRGPHPSCFEVVAEELGCDEATVRKAYYEWETVDDIQFPRPTHWPAHLPWPPPSK